MRLTAGLTLLLSCAPLCDAQTRPRLTEQAHTAPAGSLVLESGVDWITAEPNFVTGGERDLLEGPLLRLVWSPAPSVELDLEWVGRVVALDDPEYGTTSDWGDVTLRAKACLVEERAGRAALAVRFGVSLPETSADQGLGPNALRMSVEALLSKTLGRFAIHANAGLAIHDEVAGGREQNDFLAFGLALERRLGDRVTLLAEAAGRSGKGTPGADERSEARLGMRYAWSRFALDAALRHGLTETAGGLGFTAGFAWKLKAPGP